MGLAAETEKKDEVLVILSAEMTLIWAGFYDRVFGIRDSGTGIYV